LSAVGKVVTPMSSLVKKWIPTLIATITGLVVLFGYLFPNRLLTLYRGRVTELRDVLVEWAVIVAAFAFFLGMVNILRVHVRRLFQRGSGRVYSLVLLFAMVVALVLTLIPPLLPANAVTQNLPDLSQAMFDYLISPLGASLAALVVFTLVLAALRLLRARRRLGAAIFLVIVVVILLGSTPLTGLGWLAGVREWIINVPGMAGMRGLLLGVVLGTVITALRMLMGSERPYSES
jgi:type IV secretory pathway VirB2 component (pilin)